MGTLEFEEKKKFLAFVKSETIDLPDYEVVDVEKPKLYKDIFPFSAAPKAVFDGVMLNTTIPDKLWLSDTSFRDGQQSREPYSSDQIVSLFRLLHDLGGKNGKVNYTEFFPYTEKDREAIKKCMDLGYEFPRITGWIRSSKADLEHIKKIELGRNWHTGIGKRLSYFLQVQGKKQITSSAELLGCR